MWGGVDVYLIEGEFTRCGVGNDLLNNASSVHGIICPSTNAWESYEKIVETAVALIPLENSVVLCCLGPTATVLAYDLHKRGYRALDLGHIDIEYEWFKSGTTVMTKIAGKAVNEMHDNSPTENDLPEEYVRQIIARVS